VDADDKDFTAACTDSVLHTGIAEIACGII
jgi:hypothetical protein